MYVGLYLSLIWALRSLGKKGSFLAGTLSFPAWGLSLPYLSSYVSVKLFGIFSKQIGLFIIVLVIAATTFLLSHYVFPEIESEIESCTGEECFKMVAD